MLANILQIGYITALQAVIFDIRHAVIITGNNSKGTIYHQIQLMGLKKQMYKEMRLQAFNYDHFVEAI